jgi:hypothetical protein
MILVCISWSADNHDNTATGAVTITPKIISYREALVNFVFLRFDSRPVGRKANRLVKASMNWTL